MYCCIFGPKNVPFLKNPNSYFYRFLMLVIGYYFRKRKWKYLEKTSRVDLGSKKWPIYLVLNINYEFFSKIQTATFNHLQCLSSDTIWEKTEWTDFEKSSKLLILDPKMTHFRHNKNFPLKSQTVSFTHLLMPTVKYDFRKIQRKDFGESSKILILGIKMSHLPLLKHNKNCGK